MDIYIRKFNLEKANKLKVEFFVEFMILVNKQNQKGMEKETQKGTVQSLFAHFEGKEMLYDALKYLK